MDKDIRHQEELNRLATYVGKDWVNSDAYYDSAEVEMDFRWEHMIWPFIGEADFSKCVDLAAGHGRNTRKLLEQQNCQEVFLIDINQENIDFCTERYISEPRVKCIKNNGFLLGDIPDGHITMFYCFDAMVHFESDVVRSYLKEISRVLSAGGSCFLHHSNYRLNPAGDVHDNPAWRNYMSMDLFKHYAHLEGLNVERQKLVDWLSDGSNIDCFTLLKLANRE